MKNFRPGFWPTMMTIPMIAIMLALCIWQLSRYNWKVNMIETINTQLSAPAVELPENDIVPKDWYYKRVSVRGMFDHSNELHLFAHAVKGRKGFQIITPFIRENGKGIVLVNRGWVPEDNKDAATRPQGQISGIMEVRGVVRTAWTKHWSFMPASNATDNVWLYGELAEMAAHLDMEVAPVFVELENMPVPGGLPIGGQTRVSIPNNHIEYFLTWLGLAAAMAAIYILYGVKRAKD